MVALCILVACSAPANKPILITNVTVINPASSSTRAGYSVLVQDAKIVDAGPPGVVGTPKGAIVIDGSGKFLIPGLCDMHVHLTGAGEPNGSREFILPLLVANGITTVREMGGYIDAIKSLRAEIASGKRIGPEIYFTGPYLDGKPPSFQPSIVVESAADAEAAVQKLKDAQVSYVKVQSRLRPDAYFAIADAARRHDLRFVGHVPDTVSASAASDAGQYSIEHLTGVLLATSSREEELRGRLLTNMPNQTAEQAHARMQTWIHDLLKTQSAEKSGELYRKFATNGTWNVPTLVLLKNLAYLTPETRAAQDWREKYLPAAEREIWQRGIRDCFAGEDGNSFAQRAELMAKSIDVVRGMHDAGAPLMAGTDTSAPNVYPGFSLHEELALLVRAGLTPMEALQTATSRPAEFLGKKKEQGMIARGMKADLVLLDANPLERIENTQKIRAVIINGRLLDRAALDAMLEKVERNSASH